jgi:hypothetical protein
VPCMWEARLKMNDFGGKQEGSRTENERKTGGKERIIKQMINLCA